MRQVRPGCRHSHEGQVQRIYDYRMKATTPLELQNTAMVMVGQELGLRASDVTNLKLLDINWKSRQISIIQQKTRTAIVSQVKGRD